MQVKTLCHELQKSHFGSPPPTTTTTTTTYIFLRPRTSLTRGQKDSICMYRKRQRLQSMLRSDTYTSTLIYYIVLIAYVLIIYLNIF